MTNWHAITTDAALKLTDSSPAGLSAAQAETRLRQHGRNELLEKAPKTVWKMLLGQFKDTMILVLIAAAVVAGLLGDLTDTIVILVIVVLNAAVGFFQEYRAEKAMEALKKMSPPSATIVREGLPVETDAATSFRAIL